MTIKLVGAGTAFDYNIDWDDEDQPLVPIGSHPCCGSSERCWACADNEELARIMAKALAPLCALVSR